MKNWNRNRVTKIQTPCGLAFALSFNTGIRNTMVQLIDMDKPTLNEFEATMDHIVKKMKQYYTRANHFFYFKPTANSSIEISTLRNLVFDIEIQSFSAIDDPYRFHVDMTQNTFEPVGTDSIELEPVHEVEHTDDMSTSSPTNTDVQDFAILPRTQRHSFYRRRCSVIELESNENDGSIQADSDSSSDEDYRDDSSDSSDDEELTNVKDTDIREYCAPTQLCYQQNSMITRVQIIKQQCLGKVSAYKGKRKNDSDINNDVVQVRQDSLALAVRRANNIISSSTYFRDSKQYDKSFDLAINYNAENNNSFNPSWARRQGYGKLYGNDYVKNYKKDLQQMFLQGKANSAQKMNPGKMREQLQQMYPFRFSIPGETEIKKFIGSEFQKEKNANRNENSTRTRNSGPQNTVWFSMLTPLVKSKIEERPAKLFDYFIDSLGDITTWPEDLPRTEEGTVDKKKITQAVSYIKTKTKKADKRALLA